MPQFFATFKNSLLLSILYMGRIKTKLTKRLTLELLDKHREKLTTEFDANKKIVEQLMIGTSKKLRNVIAGYVTRLKKKD